MFSCTMDKPQKCLSGQLLQCVPHAIVALPWPGGSRKPLATWATVFGRSLHLDCAYAACQDIVKTLSRVWECFMPFLGSDKMRQRLQDPKINEERSSTFAFWTYLLSIFTNKNPLDLSCITVNKIIFPTVCTIFKHISLFPRVERRAVAPRQIWGPWHVPSALLVSHVHLHIHTHSLEATQTQSDGKQQQEVHLLHSHDYIFQCKTH